MRVEFNEEFIKKAIAINYGIAESDVKFKNYSDEDILDSIDWYLRKEDKYLEIKEIATICR